LKRLALLVVAVLLQPVWASGQQPAPIRYSVDLSPARTHYVNVEASIPADGERQIELMMPVWTPGSYLVREYSRNVESVGAFDPGGAALAIEKTRKNRWRVSGITTPSIVLRYRVYAHEASVRTNWVDGEFAVLNAAATFITRLTGRDRQYEIRLTLPVGWSKSLSSLTTSAPNAFTAPDYDTLVDSPIVAGNPAVYEFSAGGRPHVLVDLSERGAWDGARVLADLQKVVGQNASMWGVVPYDRYYFFNVVGWSFNALEHKSAVMMGAPRGSLSTRDGYLRWLSVAAHEHFHAWNVKRLRPIELGPFDYENEVYTRSLWFSEGVTDYYADLQLRRAGVSTPEEYLAALSSTIATLQTTPGRLVQPLELSSFDAWIKYYRPDDNSTNASISYYSKGAIVGFLLDSAIRKATGSSKTLDDFMRSMYQRFSGAKGFTPDELRSTAIAIAGGTAATPDLSRWFHAVLDTTGELDYGGALDWLGLEFMPLPPAPRPWLGIRTRVEGQRTIVAEVLRGSPAARGGVDVDDEIVAVNGVDVAGRLTDRLAGLQPGAVVVLGVSSQGENRRLEVTLEVEPSQRWSLGVVASPSAEQTSHLKGWLEN